VTREAEEELKRFDLAAGDCAYKALSARGRRTDAELDEKIASSVADPADDPEVY
jgi:hypothetical protein